MRIFRIAVASTLLSIATSVVVLTASVAHAAPFTYSSVSVGFRNACAVTTDGKVVCWGDNVENNLIPTRTDRYIYTPVPVAFPEPIATVDVGYGYTKCAQAVSGRAYCWGTGGHLGSYFTTTSTTPVQVEFANDMRVTNVQNGSGNACALDASRTMWCWGDPLSLGDGNTEPLRIPVRLPMPDNSPVAHYDMGIRDSCAITDAGHMYCWGDNSAGEFNAPSFAYGVPHTIVAIPAPAGRTWAKAYSEGERICGIDTTGDAYCAGDNYNGDFGNDTYVDSYVMTRMNIPNNEAVESLHLGMYFSCAITQSHQLWCVGEGSSGQLGTGTTLGGKTWRKPLIPAGVTFTVIDSSHSGTCAIDTNSHIWCWSSIAQSEPASTLTTSYFAPTLRPQVGSPDVSTPEISHITAGSATISASALPYGFATTGSLEYSTDASFASSTIVNVAGRTIDGSSAALALTATVSGLAPRTTYYVRASARNLAGETVSGVASFLTLGSEPTVLQLLTTNVTGNEATVSAQIDPGYLTTDVRAEISDTTSFPSNAPSVSMGTINGDATAGVSAQLNDLLPQHTYYVRVVATNVLGSTVSESISFTTVGSAPTVTTVTAGSSTTSISASVGISTGNTRGTVTYQVSRSSNFAVLVHSDSRSFTSAGPETFTFESRSLLVATDYWVRAIATNALGTHTGTPVKVRTRGAAPTIGTLSVAPILRGATFAFPLDTTGLDTLAIIDIATDRDMQHYTSHFAYSGVNQNTNSILLTVSNLNPAIEYFARVTASNELGRTESNIVSFRTVRPMGLVINDDEVSTTDPHVTLNFRYPADTVAIRISNNADFSGARIFLPQTPIGWDLITGSEEESLRTVYVQFINQFGQATLYTDEISLETDIAVPDEDAPVITSLRAVTSTPAGMVSTAAVGAKKNIRQFVMAVSDKVSGVTRIQTRVGSRITTQKVDAVRKGEYTLSFARSVKSFSVRVADRFGNMSKWRTITVR